LAADPEAEFAYQSLNLFWGREVPQDMMKDNCQQERTLVLLHGHPFGREHHTGTAIYLNDMIVIVDKFFGLLTRANSDRLIGVNSIKVGWTGHAYASAFVI